MAAKSIPSTIANKRQTRGAPPISPTSPSRSPSPAPLPEPASLKMGHVSKGNGDRAPLLLSTFEKGGRTFIRLQPACPTRRITAFKHRGRSIVRVSALPLAIGADAPDYHERVERGRGGGGIVVAERNGRKVLRVGGGGGGEGTPAWLVSPVEEKAVLESIGVKVEEDCIVVKMEED